MVYLRNGKDTNNIDYVKKTIQECSICFNTLNPRNCIYLTCGHCFCPCLFSWFVRDLSCPLCRKPVHDFRAKLSVTLSNELHYTKQRRKEVQTLVACFVGVIFLLHINRLDVNRVMGYLINVLLLLLVAEFLRILKQLS